MSSHPTFDSGLCKHTHSLAIRTKFTTNRPDIVRNQASAVKIVTLKPAVNSVTEIHIQSNEIKQTIEKPKIVYLDCLET